MKYYRMKNPNWDGKNPAYQWRIAVTIEEDGVEKFITLITTNGQRHVETIPVKECVIVPARYQLDKSEFHTLRNYIECLGVANMEEVSEEQVKAEETIDMNSGFGWLDEDRKESLRLNPAKRTSNPRPANSNSRSSGGGNEVLDNPFRVSKSNIFGIGTGAGTFISRTPTFSPPFSNRESIGYDSDGNNKSAEEIMAEFLEVKTQLSLNPKYSINPKGNK